MRLTSSPRIISFVFLFIYIFFEGSPTLLFVYVVTWNVDIVDNNSFAIC